MKSPPIREVLPKVSKTRLFWMRSNCPVQLLDKDQPVHMIIRGDQNKYIPFYKTIESLAAHYSQEIQALQPEGPYILSGYCYWGIVALEIAQHLKRQGQEVDFVFLIDPPLQGLPNTSTQVDHLKMDHSFRPRVSYHTSTLKGLGYTNKINYVFQKLANRFKEKMKVHVLIYEIKVAICRTCVLFKLPVPNSLIRFYINYPHAKQLLEIYVPKAYPGKIVIVHADKFYRGVHPTWSGLAVDEVIVHEVPNTTHTGILRKPSLEIWTKWLNTHLLNTKSGN